MKTLTGLSKSSEDQLVLSTPVITNNVPEGKSMERLHFLLMKAKQHCTKCNKAEDTETSQKCGYLYNRAFDQVRITLFTKIYILLTNVMVVEIQQ